MTIELTPESIIDTFWFIGHSKGDVIGCLWKPKATDEWRFDYRFRWNGDGAEDPHSTKNNDKKSRWQASAPAGTPVEKLRDGARKVMETVRDTVPGGAQTYEELYFACSGDEAAAQIGLFAAWSLEELRATRRRLRTSERNRLAQLEQPSDEALLLKVFDRELELAQLKGPT